MSGGFPVRLLLGLALLHVLNRLPGASAGCTSEGGSCICMDADGDLWDMTELGGLQKIIGPPSSTIYMDFEYNFDICDVVTVPQAPPTPCPLVATTVAYRIADRATGTTPGLCQQLGPISPTGLTLSKIGGLVENGVAVAFTHLTYTILLNINCDEGADRASVAAPPANGLNSVVMEWDSYYTCPVHQSGAASWGTPFLIVACVAGVFYAGGGWYYNHRQSGLNGKEALPHVDFWTRALPTAVMDGILFTRMQLSARFGSGSGGENYTKARDDDESSASESNDDGTGSSDEEAPTKKPEPAPKKKPKRPSRAKVKRKPLPTSDAPPLE